MVAYKIWYDTKHFIHKSTTDELNVTWTEDVNEAKDVEKNKAYDFFFTLLGFSPNARYDALKLQ